MKSILSTPLYKELNLMSNLTSTYLFYSNDRVLNDEIALLFAKSLMCEQNNACDICPACAQFDSKTNPDLYIIDQDSVKVDDVNNLISKLATKPISYKHKIFVILNADRINEIAQNKLLKSLEEPNTHTIFILTTTKMDKILPTVLSRLKKIFVPKLSRVDKAMLAQDIKFDISSYMNIDITLTEILRSQDSMYMDTVASIKYIFEQLNTTADIPRVVSSIKIADKTLFLSCMQDIFLDVLRAGGKYGADVVTTIKNKFNNKAIIKCIPLIENAYKQQMSNVNINYILDNLLFNILKEKFLCK